ncbi:secreted RxLR effector protein 161-like [Schistocerca piceifrons]|uniref:secreted RxLR effector protein 161-like n=1 Tax=Schistocerca piceifrons TaxID=274613 RepID=UPI001F5F6CAE|nr:secreted RxLR effector protein 161-like [Schistocerca piceifrons]
MQQMKTNSLNMRHQDTGSQLEALAMGTRPDLAIPATYLNQFSSNPSEEHWRTVKHTLRYLHGTMNDALVFCKTGKKFMMYTDADWGADPNHCKSISGYLTVFWGAVVIEFVALSETVREAKWMNSFLSEIGEDFFLHHPMKIFINNQGVEKLTENHEASERTKHMDLKIIIKGK